MGVIGAMQALEAVKLCAGVGTSLAGRLVLLDGWCCCSATAASTAAARRRRLLLLGGLALLGGAAARRWWLLRGWRVGRPLLLGRGESRVPVPFKALLWCCKRRPARARKER